MVFRYDRESLINTIITEHEAPGHQYCFRSKVIITYKIPIELWRKTAAFFVALHAVKNFKLEHDHTTRR